MKLSDITPELGARLGCTFVTTGTGDERYVRVFVLNSQGQSIGRGTVFEGRLDHIKWYKDKLHGNDVPFDESDVIKAKLEIYKSTGTVVATSVIEALIPYVKALAPYIRHARILHRGTLQPKSRPAVTGPAPRSLFYSEVSALIARIRKGELS